MNRHVKFALVLVILTLCGWMAWKYVLSGMIAEQNRTAASDANGRKASERFKMSGDNYAGYVALASPEFQKGLLSRGMANEFLQDDGGDYTVRLKKFADGRIDLMVIPIASYIEHGAGHNYPGVVIATISDSRGADAVLAFNDKLKTVNDLNDPTLSFVYVGGSASEWFLNVLVDNFGLDKLKGSTNWRQAVASPKELMDRMREKQGDVFITWEPNIAKAVQLGAHMVIDSSKTRGVLQDVLVARRDVVAKRKAALTTFVTTYFRGLELYTSDRKRLVADIGTFAGVSEEQATSLIGKLHWYTRAENARDQFGVTDGGKDGLIDSIIEAQSLLVRIGILSKPTISDPYSIISSDILKEVARATDATADQQTAVDFAPLSDQQWKEAKRIGTLRVENIAFQSGMELLDLSGKEQVDEAVKLLNRYPELRVEIGGHTGNGDETENLKLSKSRAEAVMQYMVTTLGVNPNRLHAMGYGSSKPLPRKPGESPRAYSYRLPRVEFVLVEASVF